jgi:hypothetical protein
MRPYGLRPGFYAEEEELRSIFPNWKRSAHTAVGARAKRAPRRAARQDARRQIRQDALEVM